MQVQKLGRYEILAKLGDGVLGPAFVAQDPKNGTRVVVKLLEALGGLDAAQQATAHEALTGALDAVWRLSHPGVVSVLEAHDQEGVPCIVREYVDGVSLSEFSRLETPVTRGEAIELIASAAEALDHAHANGVVHGDMKPGNLIRVGESTARVTDFMLASSLRAALGPGSLPESPSYMSPEQLRGRGVDARSDLFSLCGVLFELLCGVKPFPGDTASSIVFRIVHDEPVDPADTPGGASPEIAALLLRGLDKLPERRFQSGLDLTTELRRVASAISQATLDEPLPARSEDAETESAAAEAPRTTVPAAAPARAARVRSSLASRTPAILGTVIVVAVLVAGVYSFRERLGLVGPATPPVIWWEARVKTEPPGAEVALDGVPLDLEERDFVRFRPEGPFGTLTATLGCRQVQRQLQPSDAGGEIVLVLDPVTLDWTVDPGVSGARVTVNGSGAGGTPAELQLDLCRDNDIAVLAEGYEPASVALLAGATPLEARTALYALALDRIPIGRLVVPDSSEVQLVYYLDGKRLGSSERELDLQQGEHEFRYKNEYHWIDVRVPVQVVGGKSVTPDLGSFDMATLVVQAYPPNCKVYLRKPGGSWRYLDETPASRRVAPGSYEVKIELNTTGETEERSVDLVSGDNSPVRVSFGKR